MKRLLSYYHPKLAIYLTYMFQQVEYNPHKFVSWIRRLPDLTKVMHRQALVKTGKAKILILIIFIFWLCYFLITVWYFFVSITLGFFSLLISPFLVILLSYITVLFGWIYYEEPRRRKVFKNATKDFAEHTAIKIAIAGSYGKTTMKELLSTVLSEGLNVSATPGNKNVPISHSAWVKKLSGEEKVLLIEYGEGAPGDIKKLATLTSPDYGIITGLAPNHLDEYKTFEAVAKDLLSLKDYVPKEKLFISSTDSFSKFIKDSEFSRYSSSSALGWKVSDIKISLVGTSFKLAKAGNTLKIESQLLGRHQVGPLALAAGLAHQLGLSKNQIETGIKKTIPFEHRMQPRIQNGAWIIDDTYNGSLEGIRAGLDLLRELPAKRKVYVTPGLVDQGEETERVHVQIGEMIASANPDKTVLMKNSTTEYVLKGLDNGKYTNEIKIEPNPLEFYTNLEHIIANGDLVMMQNDWTDNYS